jgi:hypothetical protein
VGEKEGFVLFCGCDSFGKISELDRSRNESRLGLACVGSAQAPRRGVTFYEEMQKKLILVLIYRVKDSFKVHRQKKELEVDLITFLRSLE